MNFKMNYNNQTTRLGKNDNLGVVHSLKRMNYFLILVKICSVILFAQTAIASETIQLNCKLYMAITMDEVSTIDLPVAGVTLSTTRRAGICIFPDGSVADKQFVIIDRVKNGGSVGSNHGFSVYTFENGDTLSAEFWGKWDENGFSGDYKVIEGTGKYQGSTGIGSITPSNSPWKTLGVVNIELNLKNNN